MLHFAQRHFSEVDLKESDLSALFPPDQGEDAEVQEEAKEEEPQGEACCCSRRRQGRVELWTSAMHTNKKLSYKIHCMVCHFVLSVMCVCVCLW